MLLENLMQAIDDAEYRERLLSEYGLSCGNSFREIKLGFTQLNDEQSWCRRVK